jgi:hypothetical protein
MTEGCARGRELSVFHMGRIGVGPKARPPPVFGREDFEGVRRTAGWASMGGGRGRAVPNT